MYNNKKFAIALILAAALRVSSAHAATTSDDGDQVRQDISSSSQDIAFNDEPVSNEALATMTGAFNPEQLGIALFDATTVGNNVNASATGFNNISSDAFGNSKGVVNLIQNTGNNVIIQNATIVNLSLSK